MCFLLAKETCHLIEDCKPVLAMSSFFPPNEKKNYFGFFLSGGKTTKKIGLCQKFLERQIYSQFLRRCFHRFNVNFSQVCGRYYSSSREIPMSLRQMDELSVVKDSRVRRSGTNFRQIPPFPPIFSFHPQEMIPVSWRYS